MRRSALAIACLLPLGHVLGGAAGMDQDKKEGGQ